MNMKHGKKLSPSKLHAVMIYLKPVDADRLTRFAKNNNASKSQIAREGIEMRMDLNPNQFNAGFNEGLNAVIEVINKDPLFGFRFPSGQTGSAYVINLFQHLFRKIDE